MSIYIVLDFDITPNLAIYIDYCHQTCVNKVKMCRQILQNIKHRQLALAENVLQHLCSKVCTHNKLRTRYECRTQFREITNCDSNVDTLFQSKCYERYLNSDFNHSYLQTVVRKTLFSFLSQKL